MPKLYRISPETQFRFAKKGEAPLVLTFIKELAAYEKLEGEVTATVADLHRTLFKEKRAEVLFCVHRSQIVGFALFFHNYSTFLGKPGLYLEDLYIRPAFRSLGLGRAFFTVLATIARERGCGRMEWWCLDWNQKAIDFYLKLGAQPMSDWTVYRIPEGKWEALGEARE